VLNWLVYFHVFLTSALVWGEWWASRPGRFTPGVRALGTHWIGGWGEGLRVCLDDVQKSTFLTLPWLELRPLGCPARNQSLYWLRYPRSLTSSRYLIVRKQQRENYCYLREFSLNNKYDICNYSRQLVIVLLLMMMRRIMINIVT
jgi:hypothetical protein